MSWMAPRNGGYQPGRTSPPRAEFPHCNSEVLHEPGTCQYCDAYPDRQAMRTASNTPFTPAEANGWHGNMAHPDRPYVIYRDSQSPRSFRRRLRDFMGLR